MYEYSIMELFGQILHRMWENITSWKKKKLDQNALPSFLRNRPIPESTGDTIKFRRYERLPGEGVTPSRSEHG